jgi:hypothetical protein
MKKIFATSTIFILFAVAAFAQTQSDLYKMKTASDAEIVLKALSSQLNLTGDEFAKVREILNKSALSQQEQAARKENQTPEMESMILNRQTMHIETNLKGVIGEEKYKLYESLKVKIAEQVKSLRKN